MASPDLLLRDRAPATPTGQEATLTPFLVAGGPRPAFVVCPGGALVERAAHEGAPIAAWLNRLGLHAFVLNYRLLPEPPTAALSDAARAVRYLRHHAERLRVDARRIGMIGFSAGGFLTAFVGTRFDHAEGESPEDEALGAAFFPRDAADPVDRESARLDAMVLAYPSIKVTAEDVERSMPAEAPALPPGLTPARAASYFSSDAHVTARTAPTFLWVTSTDSRGMCPDTLAFAQALARGGASFELHVFPRGWHGLGLAEGEPSVAAWTGLCERWLRELWGEPAFRAG